jgi:replicative DNA helicase
VIDYADLISSKIKGEYRHQLDDIWANLRRLALERNICVVTASQSGRAAARGDSSDENIAEDIRKVAHVTKMIAINATKEDKMNSVYRVSQIVERDDATNYEQCFLLSCLDLGQVCLDSRFKSEVYFKKETE